MQRAHDGGEDAKLMSVLAPGYGSAIDLGDLGLRKKYSVTAAGLQMPSYNDCMIEVRALPPYPPSPQLTSSRSRSQRGTLVSLSSTRTQVLCTRALPQPRTRACCACSRH
jgi:hypothetical protein